MSTSNQGETEIWAITGLEAIRLRPGMFMGAVSDPDTLFHILCETIDSPIAEVMAGQCSQIEITVHPDSSITVSDNGAGLPTEDVPNFNASKLEVLMSMVAIPGLRLPFRYHVSGGLHGIGLKAVNALSESFIVEVRRHGYMWRISSAHGVETSELIQVRPMHDDELKQSITSAHN